MLGQYPLEALTSAPKVRTFMLHQALQELAEVDFITGTRRSRRWPLLKYLLSGRLFRVQAVYLEAATSTSMEVDILLLLIARIWRIPMGIFIRDAHPLFQMIDSRPWKHKLLILGWHLSIWCYKKLAQTLYYPSASFASLFSGGPQQHVVLPPGGRQLAFEPLPHSGRRYILYAGGLTGIYGGVSQALQAVKELSPAHPELRFLCVCRPEEAVTLQAWKHEPWLEIQHLDTEGILAYQSQIYLSVICLQQDPYSDLALPLKLFDYLALGKPVLATPCHEMQQFIEAHQVGLIAQTSADFKLQIQRLLDDETLANEMGQRATELIHNAHSWSHRAQTILDTLLPETQTRPLKPEQSAPH